MKNTTTRLSIVAGITLTLLAVFVYVQVLLAQNANDLTAALQTITNREAVMNEFQTVNTLLEETAQQRAELASFIIDGDDGTIEFLTTLEARAAARRVTLVGTQLSSQTNSDFVYDELVVVMSFAGTKADVQQFITDIENLPYALYITALSTQRSSGNGGSIEVSGTLTLAASAINIDV